MTPIDARRTNTLIWPIPGGQGLAGRVAMVTGANDGIGRATALGLARLAATVVMVCRNAARGEAAQAAILADTQNSNIELMLADLSSQSAIRDLVSRFCQTHDRLHILVNNAGVNAKQFTRTVDGLELNFAVNHLAYFMLARLLLNVLKVSAPARIVNVASAGESMGKINLDDLMGERHYSSLAAHAQSKLANVLFTYELARRLAGTGVTVNCCHPGITRTKITQGAGGFAAVLDWVGRQMGQSPEKGAETVLYLACSPEVEGIAGRHFENQREKRTSPGSYDATIARRLWQASVRVDCGVLAELANSGVGGHHRVGTRQLRPAVGPGAEERRHLYTRPGWAVWIPGQLIPETERIWLRPAWVRLFARSVCDGYQHVDQPNRICHAGAAMAGLWSRPYGPTRAA
jgi:retinol dehydrogenase 14